MKKQVLILGLLLSGAALPAFAGQPMAGMEMQEKTVQASHQGTGKVVAVDRAKLSIKLAHEPIKSLGWPGMTMDFNVANASLLDGLKEGDTVQFDLGKTKPDDLAWVIVKIKRK
ncbi:copper-binding protein [Sideroxyarcus sp. TK5]